MSVEESWQFLSNFLTKQFIFLARPAVQNQLLAILAAILLARLFSHRMWRWLKQRFPQVTNFTKKDVKLSPRQYGMAFIYYFLNVFLSLLGLYLLRNLFVSQGWLAGLFKTAIELVRAYFFYVIFLLSLCIFFPVRSVRRYELRFFTPIFVLYAAGKILSLSTNLPQLMRASPLILFGGQVSVGEILLVTIGLYLWIVGVSLQERLLVSLLTGGMPLKSGTVQAAQLLVRYFLIGLGIVVIFGYVGVNPTAFAAITGGLSVGIGFGLKEVFSNFISGLWLLFEGSLRPGDIISIEGEMSEVKELGIRAAKVQMVKDNSEKIIPNQTFFTQDVTTLTGSDRLVYRSLTVGASYGCDPQKVIGILKEVACQHSRVLQEPSPVAFFIGFGESSLDFELKFWIEDPLSGKSITSELGCAVWQAFAQKGIEIPFPQRDLHLRSVDG